MRNLIDLAIRRRSGVHRAIFPDGHRLDLEFLGFKDDCAFAIRRDAIDARGSSGGRVHCAVFVRSHRPDEGGRTGIKHLEGRREFQCSLAADGYAPGGATFKIFVAGFLPETGALGQGKTRNKQNRAKIGFLYHRCVSYLSG